MRVLMTLLWISVAVGPIAADFNATHLFNPGWPPHARYHLMTVFTTAVALGLFGLYLCWGPAACRLRNLRLSALLGFLYLLALIVAALLMPWYGGSLDWTDAGMRPASVGDRQLIVFSVVGIIFAVSGLLLWRRSS